MIQIRIEPMDTLFFRDHRPFNAGVDTVAEFNFPSPLTFFGAIGSAVLDSTRGAEWGKFVRGEYEHPKLGAYDADLKNTGMKLKGPFLHKGNEIFFPPPANLWIVRGKDSIPYISLPNSETDSEWKSKEDRKHIIPLNMPEAGQMEPLNEYISTKYLTQYLSNSLPPTITVKSEEEFFVREDRYGHVLSRDSLTVEEGYLYTTTHLRFKDKFEHITHIKTGFTLIADGIDETDIPDKTIALGGERRSVMISTSQGDNFIPKQPEVLKGIQRTKRFFIYLATPAIFRNGWYRDFSLEFNGDLRMVGAAVKKPLYISGWKIRGNSFKGEPRPIRKAVPSGSVYFFEAESWNDGQFEAFYGKYHFKESLSDEYPSAGFGIGLIGSW